MTVVKPLAIRELKNNNSLTEKRSRKGLFERTDGNVGISCEWVDCMWLYLWLQEITVLWELLFQLIWIIFFIFFYRKSLTPPVQFQWNSGIPWRGVKWMKAWENRWVANRYAYVCGFSVAQIDSFIRTFLIFRNNLCWKVVSGEAAVSENRWEKLLGRVRSYGTLKTSWTQL